MAGWQDAPITGGDSWSSAPIVSPDPEPIDYDTGTEAPILPGISRAVIPPDAPVPIPQDSPDRNSLSALISLGLGGPQMSPNEAGRPVGDMPAFGMMGGTAPNDWAREEIARQEAARGLDAGKPIDDPFAQEGMTDLLARRGQQFVQQLGQFVGNAIASDATRSAVSERSISDDAGGYVNQAMEQLRLVDEKLNSGAKFSEAERAQIMDVRRQALQTIAQYSEMAPGSDLAKGIQNAEDRPAMSAGQKVAEAITQTVGAPDPRDQSFFGKVFGGLGSAAGFVGGAGIGTLLGGPVGGLVAGAGLGSETAMVEGYKQAKEAGADEETALRAAKFYRVIGSGEVLPVMTALKFLPHPLKATVGSQIMKHFAHIAESSGEEALQEGMSQFFKNVTDQQLYDPDKGWMDGVGENAIIGALVGGITGAGGTMLTGNEVQAPAAPQEPPVQPQAGPAGGIPPQEGVPPVTPAPIAPVTAPEAPLALTNPVQNDNAPEAVNGAAGTVSPPLAVAPAAATPPPVAAVTPEAPINRGPKPPAPQKRPFTSLIKRGGIRIDPDSEIADDLRHNGVTPQTAPGLFASGGLKHLDNLVADEYPEIRDLIGYEGETSYLSQQAILDALVSEAGGNPVQSAEEQAKQADWDAFQRGVASIDDDFADAPRHINYGVAPVDEDVSTQGERYRQVSSLVDEFTQEFNLAGVLTPEERDMVIDHLVANGGDAEATITGIIERRALSDENGTGIEAEEPPFPTDNAGAGSDRQSVIQPAGERTNGRGQDNGQEPSRSAEPPRSAEFPVEDTPEGQQLLVPGTDTVQTGQDQRARAEAAVRQQQSKMRRGDQSRVEDEPNSLFGPGQDNLLDSADVPRGSKPQVVRDAAPSQRRIADDEQTSEPRKTKPQPKGTLGPTFLDFSFTNRNSVFEAAFRDAGIEPDAARLLTVDQQIAKLREVLRVKFGIIVQLPTRTVMKKTITGRKVPVEREEISTRDAIDQMLDAYRQLQVMTHILGLPTDAVSLKKDGKPLALSLTRKLKGALGMFSYDKETNVRTIHLPGRSNSFAHEWGHALDQWLGGYLFDGTDRQIERLLSQDVFKDGMDPKATNDEQVAASFVALMRAMFTDRLKLAAMQMALERQSVETNKAGKPTKAALKAQKILKDMEAGKKPPKEVVTRYFETSAEFDEMFGTDGYFQSPHEMLARAFETYIGVQASALSDLPGGFLTKGSWAYTGSDEQRASMTFPRGMDAEKITIAFNDLASALREREVFGPGRSEMPADDDVYDMRVWNRWKPRGSLWERHKRERESAKAAAKAAKEELHKGPSKTRRVISAVDYVASTFAGHARGLVKQQPKSAQKVLTNLLDMFMTHPGSGRKITGVWEEAVTWISKGYTNKLDEIIEEFGLDPITADQQTELRRLMTVPGVKATDPRLMKAAAALRRLLDDAWRYVDSAGIPIGYTRNGWLPRILNHQAINDNQQGFMDQAAKVYSLMFDRDIRNESDFEVQAKDMLLLMRRLSGTSRPDGKGGTYKTNLFSSDDKDTLQVWQDALKVVRRRQRELDAANKDGDGDKVSAAEANLETAMEAYNDVLEDALDVLSRVFSEESAFQWKQRAELGNSMDFDTKGPSTTFLKSRTLPAEADDIMIDYYERNPITAIQSYLSMVPRRVEYVKRAGLHSEKLENMLAKAVEEGVSNKDITKIRHMIELMTGRSIRHEDSDLAWVAGWGYVTATIGILKWATASSLAEPISAGIRSGDVRDSLHALTMTLVQMTRQGDSAGRTEVGRIIGLITSATHETIMLNRFGGDIDPNNLQAKTLSNFFKYTLLTQLTNIQRTAMLATTNRIITRYLKKAIESDSEGGRKRATEELADLGIGPEDFRDMMKWLEDVGGFPSANDLVAVDGGFYNKAAELWATANARMVEQIIQNPRKFTRTMATYDPRFGPAFNITGFIYAFHFNTLLPLFKKGIDVRGEGEGKVHFGGRVLAGSTRNIALAIPAIAALYMGQTLAFILRKTLQDAFKEDDDDEEAATRILDEVLSFDGRFGFKQMFTRSGMTGATDMLYNLYTGMKYGSDLAGAYAGPHNKFWLQDMEKVLKLGAQNSPNTETAERNAAKAIMHMMGAGLTTLAVSRLPGSPLYEPLYGAGMWAIDAYGPAERLADEMYPDPKK